MITRPNMESLRNVPLKMHQAENIACEPEIILLCVYIMYICTHIKTHIHIYICVSMYVYRDGSLHACAW